MKPIPFKPCKPPKPRKPSIKPFKRWLEQEVAQQQLLFATSPTELAKNLAYLWGLTNELFISMVYTALKERYPEFQELTGAPLPMFSVINERSQNDPSTLT